MKTSSSKNTLEQLVKSLESTEDIAERENFFFEVLDVTLAENDLLEESGLSDAVRVLEGVDALAFEYRASTVLLRTKKELRDLYYEQNRYQEAYTKSEEYIEIYEDWLANVVLTPQDEEAEIRKSLEKVQDEFLKKTVELSRKNELMEEFTINQKLINSIGLALTSSTKLSEIFRILKEECSIIMNPTSIALATVDGNIINVRYSTHGHNKTYSRSISVRADDARYVMSYCVRNNCDIKIDTAMDYHKYVSTEGIRFYDTIYDQGLNNSAIYLRLLDEGNIIGVLTFQQKQERQYDVTDLDAMKSIAAFVSIAISNARKIELIEEKTLEFEEFSLTDSLTGLKNRRAFDFLSAYFVKEQIDFAIIFTDMNHLKKVNDNLGHATGDRYLKKIGDILTAAVPFGEVHRLGGDEYAVLLEHVNREQLYEIVKNIKKKCAEVEWEAPLSVAIGCAYSDSEGINQVFSIAETRMYEDKGDYYRTYHGIPESGMVI